MKHNTVTAPSPSKRADTIQLVAHPETVKQFEDDLLNAKIGEFLGIIWGMEGRGLMQCTSLWQGLHRPLNRHAKDADTYVYVCKPPKSFIYPDKLAGNVTPVAAPKDAVFLTYAKIEENAADGEILFWEWMRADPGNTSLPPECDKRYRRKVW